VGFRVIKTAVAVVAAIYLAQFIGLQSPVSAGLLAILGIEVTKRKGVFSALKRIAASLLALLFATFLFGLFGYHVWVIGLFILIVFPIFSRTGVAEGTVTGSVVMFHMYINESISFALVWNEVLLLFIGLGTATLINIAYMPKEDEKLLTCKGKVEDLFSVIFLRIASHLRDNTIVWDGKELLDAGEAIREGDGLAKRFRENTLFFGGETYWRVYFYMRGEQLDSIHQMVGQVAQVYQTLPQGEFIAAIFEELSVLVKEEYYSGLSEKRLNVLEQRYKEMTLPQTREEFEVRAAILMLMRELRRYLYIAKKQKKQRPEKKMS
jgi:uncharacterized membrane protein YgaE (UPF0421/DUF939 family)